MEAEVFDARPYHAGRPGRAGRFGKRDRLLNVGEFKRVYRFGFHASSDRFGCYVLPTRRRRSRLGLSVSKKYGKSHLRNRIKRQLREVFRRLRHTLPVPMDVIVVPRRGATGIPLGALAAEVETLVTRALQEKKRRR